VILVRNIFQVQFGKMKEAMAIAKEAEPLLGVQGSKSHRVLTDVTGPFYTLVFEETYENLSDFEKAGRDLPRSKDWESWYRRFGALIESGRREIFTIVQ
jgi:hypothetical protein